jgi:hypothetical protein
MNLSYLFARKILCTVITYSKSLLLVIVLLCFASQAKSQILLSLFFGEKLNNEKTEFGITLGSNYSIQQNLTTGSPLAGLKLGSYFYFRVKPKTSLHIEFLALSDQGTSGLNPYLTGNSNMDTLNENASVSRKFKYLSLPVLVRYNIAGNLYIEGGAQFSLLTLVFDQFKSTLTEKNDLLLKKSYTSDYHKIDAGITSMLSYKFGKDGVNINLAYYQGVLNVLKNNEGSPIRNSSLQLSLNAPIR